MKRKHDDTAEETNDINKKQAKHTTKIDEDFRTGLFEESTVEKFTNDYASSAPYKHAVISDLISDTLLRSVRQEIINEISFTAKETDIYRIFQSGDLANLDGLEDSALKRLPSLLQLRDALYSSEFRQWISKVSGAGAVSGQKTDMAINVYKPGCHLLCHDDVIGSRRISYILYLTDPDRPWKAPWGGALRLYPTELKSSSEGKETLMPKPDWSKSIPPAWNQLSFFAVQPGQSYHDVEEVYQKSAQDNDEDDGGRVRMAISGWFHIPQEGEEGYEEGLEEKLAHQSSLQQLQGKNDELDMPKLHFTDPRPISGVATPQDDGKEDDESTLTQEDLDFLLKFISPQYLTPDTVEELAELFEEESTLQLSSILSPKILDRLESQLLADEHQDSTSVDSADWQTATPPYKHRYLFREPTTSSTPLAVDSALDTNDILSSLLNHLFPSTSFHKWLSLITGLTVGFFCHLARRFRRGKDYTLATSHNDSNMQLEWCLNLSPAKGWSRADIQGDDNERIDDLQTNGKGKGKAPLPPSDTVGQDPEQEEDSFGGYELYMAGDEDDPSDNEDDDDAGSDHGVNIPSSFNPNVSSSSATGGGHRRVLKQQNKKKERADPAVYQSNKNSNAGDDEDDGILFTNPATWNMLTVVLRDQGTMRFVKYVSKSAPGDRWDIIGSAPVLDTDDHDQDEDGN